MADDHFVIAHGPDGVGEYPNLISKKWWVRRQQDGPQAVTAFEKHKRGYKPISC